MRIIGTICWICVFLGLLHVSFPSQAQTNDTTSQAPSSAPSPVPEQPALKPAELDALVAPIALYPDTLLSNVLMASTYPLEVVRADRWMNQNKDLKGDALKAAAEKQDWDESVKALVATASVLQMMNEQLEWTQKARRGVFGTATGRDGRCAAVALKGLRQEEAGSRRKSRR